MWGVWMMDEISGLGVKVSEVGGSGSDEEKRWSLWKSKLRGSCIPVHTLLLPVMSAIA